MALEISILMGRKVISFTVDAKNIKLLAMSSCWLESPDNIIGISVSKEYIIVVTERPEVRNGIPVPVTKQNRFINNINAYDWKGNHMWNIGEIVGDICVPFYGGNVSTKELAVKHPDVNPALIDESHELYCCNAADYYQYIIDLSEKTINAESTNKVIQGTRGRFCCLLVLDYFIAI